jgi:ribosomal protein S12 methylthiotransferase accessory factor
MLRGAAYRSAKTFRAGTHRAQLPEETFHSIRPFLARAGVTRIADVTGLDNVGVPTVLALRPNSQTIACSSGKGVTLAQAYVSGAMEAFELHASETASLPSIRASYRELCDRYPMVPAADLPLSRDSLFTEEWPFHWFVGWDLITQSEVPVPLATVGMSRANALVESMGAFRVTSNGLGAGNSFLEAVAAGLYEVIERDGFACHHAAALHAGHQIPGLPDTALRHYPLVAGVLDRCERADVGVTVQDCTVDTDVPIYNAIVYDRQDRGIGVVHGTGAHLDPEIAILRAITEGLQARLNFIAGSRDDIFRSAFRRWRGDWRHFRDILEQDETDSPQATLRASRTADTFEEDIHQLLDSVQRAGLHTVVVVDLTPADFPVHIVRVLVPGLEGYMHHGYRPGRRALSYVGNGHKP